MSLSYQISTKLSEKFCLIHNMGISTTMASDVAVVKVCCPFFKEEIENELKTKFRAEFDAHKIRLQLPGIPINNTSAIIQSEE